MPSINVNPSPRKNKRWTFAEHLFFVNLLYETLRSDTIQSKKSTALKSVLESCKAQLQTKFPGTTWTYQRIRSRYDLIKCDYLAYQAALKMPGKVEVLAKGKIRLPMTQMANLKMCHHKAAARMLRNGLGVGGGVTVDTYHQIFSSNTHTGGIYTLTGQQDVAPYDKPSLNIASRNVKSIMANCCTTRSLSTLPTEVLSMIGSYFSHQDFRVVTLLSKQFRDFFFTQLFTRLRFSGDLERLGQRLKSFLNGLSTHWSRIVECRPR
jgi:hypothetical protein